MHPHQKVPIEEVCRILELPVSSWTLQRDMSVEQAQQSIDDFKNLVKTQRRELAKKYHPDKTGGDDSKIKQINNMVDIVNKIEITKMQRKLQPQNIRFHFSSNPFGNSNSTTSSFTGSFGGARFYKYE